MTSLALIRQPTKEKENSEFKSDLLRFKTDLVSYSTRSEWVE